MVQYPIDGSADYRTPDSVIIREVRARTMEEFPVAIVGRARLVFALALALSSVPPVAPLQGQSIREVFDRVSHAVVVYTSQTVYSLRSSEITAVSVGGIGSGVLISPTQILTAAHVVQAANEVLVEFPDGEVMRASVAASRVTHDVALLELESPATVAPVEIGDSDAVAVGDQIFVVGAPPPGCFPGR